MSTICRRSIALRSSLSSIKSSLKSNGPKSSTPSGRFSIPITNSTSSPLRRLSISRCRSELGGIESLLPLHSAVAAARMTSCLSTKSRSCRALSQDGIDGTLDTSDVFRELGLSVPR